MNGILSNLKIKIVAWTLASLALVVFGFFIEDQGERKISQGNTTVEVSDHDLDDILNF